MSWVIELRMDDWLSIMGMILIMRDYDELIMIKYDQKGYDNERWRRSITIEYDKNDYDNERNKLWV